MFAASTIAASSDTPKTGLGPGVTVDHAGRCVLPEPLSGRWEVWHDFTVLGPQSWLPAHVHDGFECLMTVQGTGRWWTAPGGIVDVPDGQSLLIPDLTVHTGGNERAAPMRYVSVHLIRAGSPFRTVICTAAAPGPVAGTVGTLFNNAFGVRDLSGQPVTIEQQTDRFEVGAAATIGPTGGGSYISVFEGELTLKTPGSLRVLHPGEGTEIPVGTQAAILNSAHGVSAAAIVRF
jgi:hypothetical protein